MRSTDVAGSLKVVSSTRVTSGPSAMKSYTATERLRPRRPTRISSTIRRGRSTSVTCSSAYSLAKGACSWKRAAAPTPNGLTRARR